MSAALLLVLDVIVAKSVDELLEDEAAALCDWQVCRRVRGARHVNSADTAVSGRHSGFTAG